MIKYDQTGEIPHVIYRKYSVKMQERWIRDCHEEGRDEEMRKILDQKLGELHVGDRYRVDSVSRTNVGNDFYKGAENFEYHLPWIISCSEKKDPNKQWDVTGRLRKKTADCRLKCSARFTQEQKNALGPMSNLPGYAE